MNCAYPFQAARLVRSWACLLICLALFLGGCQAKEPPLSKEAQALKKEMLKEIDKLTKALVEPVTKQDWEAIKPILQESYEEIKQAGKLVPGRIVVMDRNGITQDMYPPREGGHWDFSSYKEVREAFDNQKKVTVKIYLKGDKVYGFIAPILQEGKVIGAVVNGFPAKEMEEKWQISEKEFMSIDLNQ
jgi:hypothetical protein